MVCILFLQTTSYLYGNWRMTSVEITIITTSFAFVCVFNSFSNKNAFKTWRYIYYVMTPHRRHYTHSRFCATAISIWSVNLATMWLWTAIVRNLCIKINALDQNGQWNFNRIFPSIDHSHGRRSNFRFGKSEARNPLDFDFVQRQQFVNATTE